MADIRKQSPSDVLTVPETPQHTGSGRPVVISVSIIAGALVLCALILVGAVIKIKAGHASITVTGSARQIVRSDFILWSGSLTRQAPTLKEAFHDLRSDEEKVTTYLTTQGLAPEDINASPVETTAFYQVTNPKTKTTSLEAEGIHDEAIHKPVAFRLTESLKVASSQVDLVERLAHSSSSLMDSGVVFTAGTPQYLYRDMATMKLKVLQAAADNAHSRAESIASCGGEHAGSLNYARMGIMQVTPAYEDTTVSDQGTEDTTSKDKKVTAIVSAGYNVRSGFW
jgi:hypothetical protein